MGIFLGVILTVLLFLGQRYIFEKHWKNKLDIQLEFQKSGVEVGENCLLKEEITNGKRMPLPGFLVKFDTDRSLRFLDEENAVTTDRYYRSDVFTAGGKKKITRSLPFYGEKRGFFEIKEMQIIAQDYFFSRKYAMTKQNDTFIYVYPKKLVLPQLQESFNRLLGEIISRRSYQEDPFCFKGIRDYQPYDSMGHINWKSSAKQGQLLVNTFDTSYAQEVCILLDINSYAIINKNAVQEFAISIASTLAKSFLEQGISVSLCTNGQLAGEEQKIQVDKGSGMHHLVSIDRVLALIDLQKESLSYLELVQEKLRVEDSSVQYIFITSEHSQEWLDFYHSMLQKSTSVQVIVPQSQGEARPVEQGMLSLELELVKAIET